MELEDEATWLRHRIQRMRLAFRYAIRPEVEGLLRELIADAETRLIALEQAKASPDVKAKQHSN